MPSRSSEYEAFARRVDAELVKAKAAVDAQPIAALKATLQADLSKLQKSRREGRRDRPGRIGRARRGAARFRRRASFRTLRVERMLKDAAATQRDVEDHCVKPLAAITAKVNALPGDWKAVCQPQLESPSRPLVEVRAKLEKGEFDAIVKPDRRRLLRLPGPGRRGRGLPHRLRPLRRAAPTRCRRCSGGWSGPACSSASGKKNIEEAGGAALGRRRDRPDPRLRGSSRRTSTASSARR